MQDLTEALDELKTPASATAIAAPTGKRLSIPALLGMVATLVVRLAVIWFAWKTGWRFFN